MRDVISHPRFVSGKISTKFLAEEYPKGFKGHALTPESKLELLSVAGLIKAKQEARSRTWIAGGGSVAGLSATIQAHSSWEFYISIGTEAPELVKVKKVGDGYEIEAASQITTVSADWTLESPLINAKIGEKNLVVQYLDVLPLGFRLCHYGTKVCESASAYLSLPRSSC